MIVNIVHQFLSDCRWQVQHWELQDWHSTSSWQILSLACAAKKSSACFSNTKHYFFYSKRQVATIGLRPTKLLTNFLAWCFILLLVAVRLPTAQNSVDLGNAAKTGCMFRAQQWTLKRGQTFLKGITSSYNFCNPATKDRSQVCLLFRGSLNGYTGNYMSKVAIILIIAWSDWSIYLP